MGEAVSVGSVGSAGAVVMEIVVADDEIRHIDRGNIDTGSLSGELGSFGAVQAAIFQLCWLIPVWLLSFLAV